MLRHRLCQLPRRLYSLDALEESLKFLKNEKALIDQIDVHQIVNHEKVQIDQLIGIGQQTSIPKVHIPRLNQLDNVQFHKIGGPKLVRYLGKEYKILNDVLPYETEVTINISLSFKDISSVARHGNLLTPDKVTEMPEITFELESDEKLYSVLFADCDYPNENTKELSNYVLWSRVNIQGNGRIVLEPTRILGQELHSYQPPHPIRGTGTHRFLAALIEHSSEFKLTSDRIFNFKEALIENEGSVKGFCFFRSCWTKTVTEIFKSHIKVNEPVYGELRSPIPIKPYKYTNA